MNNLKNLRKQKNLTQQEIAKILGIEQSTYGKYERGEIPLNEIYLKKLSQIYSVSISYILNDQQDEIIITKEQYEKLLIAQEVIKEIKEQNQITIENNYGIININKENKK